MQYSEIAKTSIRVKSQNCNIYFFIQLNNKLIPQCVFLVNACDFYIVGIIGAIIRGTTKCWYCDEFFLLKQVLRIINICFSLNTKKKKNIPTYFINHYIITFHSPPISFGTRLLTFLAWCSHFNENNSGGARLFTIHNIDNYPIKFLLQAFPYIWWRDLQYPYFGSNRESEPWVRLL